MGWAEEVVAATALLTKVLGKFPLTVPIGFEPEEVELGEPLQAVGRMSARRAHHTRDRLESTPKKPAITHIKPTPWFQ